MSKKILIIIFSLLLVKSFAFAQTLYLSSQKSLGGLMVGVEIFHQKTKTSLKPLGYIYEWTFPDISLEPQKTNNNLFFVPLSKLEKILLFDLKVNKPFAEESYFFKNQKIFLAEPKAKIVRKTQEGILLPLDGKLKRDDSLTVIFKDLASKNLTYFWEFNGVFISNEKEISAGDLKEKNGTIRVRVFGNDLKEKVEDWQIIQIE